MVELKKRALRGRIARGLGVIVAVILLLILANVRSDLPLEELRPKYTNSASHFVTLDGATIHYRDEGSGPPLVLIHGTSSSLHTWDGWVEQLYSKHRIVRLDLPGFGLTGPTSDEDYSSAKYARVVAALMTQLGIPRADVAGNSLGGRVALELALEFPARVRRVILVDSIGLTGLKPPAIFRLGRTPVLNNLLRWVTPRAVVRKNLEEVYGDPSRVSNALVERHYELLRREGNRKALLDRLNRPKDPELDTRLQEIHAPVLIQWGAIDRWVPLDMGTRLHEGIAGSKLIVYPGAGHVPMEEIPAATATDAQAFLSAALD